MVESVSFLKFRRDSSSLTFSGDWSDEDDLFGAQPARRTVVLVSTVVQLGHTVLHTSPSLPGSVEMDSRFENMALSSLQPLGLPAVDKGRNPEVTPTESSGILAHANLSCPTLSCSVCPLGRGHPPYHPGCSSPMLLFPEWFRFTLGQLALSIQDKALEDVTKALKEDEELRDLSCLISLGAESAFTSPSYVYRVYCGDVPWTEGLEWLSENKLLHQLALKAFRYSFKLLFDQVSLGPIESLEELFSTLEEYERDWYIGLVADKRLAGLCPTGETLPLLTGP